MTLVKCLECGKDISDKALCCPNCGFPISQLNMESECKEELLKFPEHPLDLSLGKQIVNWKGDAAIDGVYDWRENTNRKIRNGKVQVLLYTNGISISNGFSFYPISNSQIISIQSITRDEILKMDKSVIGRAVVGGLILGPLGAIIGGMSGIGGKEKYVNVSYLVINYWDIETKKAQTLLISGSSLKIELFLSRRINIASINENNNDLTKSTSPSNYVIWFVIFMVILLTIMFFVNY